jgi:ribokinase
MANILVSGLINIETTVGIEHFPIEHSPVEYSFFGLDATVSGVGYNVAKALTTLGNRVQFLSILGRDLAVASVRTDLNANYIDDSFVLELAAQTARSVILYDEEGRCKIMVDLKDMQDQHYPPDVAEKQLIHTQAAVLCNINWSRPMLKTAREMGKLIATDVHSLSDLENDYDRDFMEAADILFMSDELLPVPAEEFAREVMARYHPKVLVIGMGSKGAHLSVRDQNYAESMPVVSVRSIVSTIGAGDALFSSFIHGYLHSLDAVTSLRKAMLFAGYKIGVRSAAEGFLSSQRLDEMYHQHYALED